MATEQREKQFQQVTELVKNGSTAIEACRQLKIPAQAFYTWKSRNNHTHKIVRRRGRNKPTVTRIEASVPDSSGKITAFYGNPDAVIAALRAIQ